jgi:galacturan 1,4-alpha-galacturonidase
MLRRLVLALLTPAIAALCIEPSVCVVEPGPNGTDSAPAIIDAFQRCGHNDESRRGKVIFKNETYSIQSVMNTTGLSHVDIDLQGTLLWDQNIPYWLNHSLPVGYQNQSSAWLFGGENINWVGHGFGTLNGNGQVWYDFVAGQNNCMSCCRPMSKSRRRFNG